MKQVTYQMIIGKKIEHPTCPPQAAPAQPNAAAAEVPNVDPISCVPSGTVVPDDEIRRHT